MKPLSADSKALLYSLLPLFGAVVVLFLIFKVGFSKISEVRSKITQAKKAEATLNEKLDLLNEVSDYVLNSSNISFNVLPESNSALSVIYQLKRVAAEKGMVLTNMKTSSEMSDKSGLKRVDITFDVEGPRVTIVDFLTTVEKIAPISLIEKVKLTESSGVSRGTIVVKSFWAELPKKLPSVAEKINGLTDEERKLLEEIATYIQPIFVSVPASDISGRSNPFSVGN